MELLSFEAIAIETTNLPPWRHVYRAELTWLTVSMSSRVCEIQALVDVHQRPVSVFVMPCAALFALTTWSETLSHCSSANSAIDFTRL